MVYQLVYILDKTIFARVVKLVDTRDLKSLASNSVPVQVRLRVPLHSPILSYRQLKPLISGALLYLVFYTVLLYLSQSVHLMYINLSVLI